MWNDDSLRDRQSLDPGLASAAGRRGLRGWKDISSYLGMSVRTVQRWERDFGLPVRRDGTGRSPVVHAFADELDKWRASVESVAAGRKAAASQDIHCESDALSAGAVLAQSDRSDRLQATEASIGRTARSSGPRGRRRASIPDRTQPTARQPRWMVRILGTTLRRVVFGMMGWFVLKVT